MNLAHALALNARNRPLHPAIVHGVRIIPHAELDGSVRRTASWFGEQGVGRGTVVGVALQDTPEHLIAIYALAALGAIVLPMDCRWTTEEQARVAGHFAAARVLLEADALWLGGAPTVRCDARWHAGVNSATPLADLADDEILPFLLSLSSGTTGLPKGPLVSHEQFQRRFWTHWINLGLNAQSRYVSATPLYFGGGRTFALSQLYSGGTVHLLPPPYEPEALVAEVERQAATALFLVPTLLRRLLALATPDRLLMPSLTLLLSSGSPLHPDERRAIRERITPNFYETYATTEGGGVSLLTPHDQVHRGDSVGRAMFGVELEVVDADDGPVAAGETGILRYRSPGCATRFHGESPDAPQMFRHGWFYPGDLGVLDSEGYLFLRGRIKEMIIRGGVNIYPNEIEAILLAHPAIAEAAVVGQPSREMGEEVAAFVITRTSVAEADLIAHCRAQLAPYKIPRTIRIVDALPKSSIGKIVKSTLAKQLPEL